MDNKILLQEQSVIFEPHVYPSRELPLIFHVNRVSVPWLCNVHENTELLYFMEGRATVLRGAERLAVSAGDLVVIDSYEPHQVCPEGEIFYACLIPSCDFCKSNGMNVDRLSFASVIRDEVTDALFWRVMTEWKGDGPFRIAAVRSAALSLMLNLCCNYSSVRETPVLLSDPTFEYIRRSIEYIKLHFSEKLTVDRIAAEVGLSKFHFLRQFKRFTSHTVVEYLNSVRCEHAKQLLQSRGCNVKEVAVRCGFENFSYFTNVFRKYTGQLPSHYLKK